MRNNWKENGMNCWKRYGILMSAVIMAAGMAVGPQNVGAEETEGRVTLHVAGHENETEAAPEETEAVSEVTEESEEATEEMKKEYPAIDAVETGKGISVSDASEAVSAILPAMVIITGTAESNNTEFDLYSGDQASEGIATGMIVGQNEEELLIAVEASTVKGSDEIRVRFAADTEEESEKGIAAKVKGTSTATSLAVLAVKLEDIPSDTYSRIKKVSFGDSSDALPGQGAVIVGNILDLGIGVTSGMVSCLGAEMENLQVPVMLVSASVANGSSGGAVLNAEGEVIGIVVGQVEGAEQMVCVVPVNEAAEALEGMMNRETRDKLSDTDHGYFGITVVNVNEDAIDLYDMPQGAFVYTVSEGSAAEEAGIKKGDIITGFNGEEILSSDDLVEKLSYYAAGETVEVEVQTANNGSYDSRKVQVTLKAGEQTEAEKETEMDPDSGDASDDYYPEDGDMNEFSLFPFGFEGTY